MESCLEEQEYVSSLTLTMRVPTAMERKCEDKQRRWVQCSALAHQIYRVNQFSPSDQPIIARSWSLLHCASPSTSTLPLHSMSIDPTNAQSLP